MTFATKYEVFDIDPSTGLPFFSLDNEGEKILKKKTVYIPFGEDADGKPIGMVSADIQPIPGTLESSDVVFDASTDLPADKFSIAVGDIIRITGFTAGQKRCKVTYHPLENTGIPFAIGARVTLNNPDISDAATKLSMIDNAKGDLVNPVESGARTLTASEPVVAYDLSRVTGSQINDIYVVGIPPDGTGAVDVLVTVEVW